MVRGVFYPYALLLDTIIPDFYPTMLHTKGGVYLLDAENTDAIWTANAERRYFEEVDAQRQNGATDDQETGVEE